MVLDRTQPTLAGDPVLRVGGGVHGGLPGPLHDFRIAGRQIRASQLEVQRRLLVGPILGLEQPLRCGLVFGFEAGLSQGEGVFEVEHAAGALA